jgi:hypothetical protein
MTDAPTLPASRDAAEIAALEHARLLHAQLLGRLGKLDLPMDALECVRDRLGDNISDLTWYARRIHDRAPQRPHDSPPWRDDPPAVRQFDADVARAKADLWRLVDGMKGAAE